MDKSKSKSKKNAFSILLTNNKQKKCDATSVKNRNGSSFVPCPLGCGIHVPLSSINRHLDKCIGNSSCTSMNDRSDDMEPGLKKRKRASSPVLMNEDSTNYLRQKQPLSEDALTSLQQDMNEDNDIDSAKIPTILKEAETSQTQIQSIDSSSDIHVLNHNPIHDNNVSFENDIQDQHETNDIHSYNVSNHQNNDKPKKDNVLSLLMKNSQHIYSQNHSTTRHTFQLLYTPHNDSIYQLFYLTPYDSFANQSNQHQSTANITPSTNDQQPSDAIIASDIKWSSITNVNLSTQREDIEDNKLQLTLVTNIQSLNHGVDPKTFTKERLVKHHSKFSVPVLKSVLQKSIRRQRPLPAVRVAMELADKSWSDLIRRLPIIILEDCILHPDLPLLVWLMIADSKDFVPTQQLIVRVMQIVFEIAYCPWRDSDTEHCANSEITSNMKPICLKSNFNELLGYHIQEKQCEIILRCFLLRKHYGGMACDMTMIDNYINLWSKRFQEKCVDKFILNRILSTDHHDENPIKWIEVPNLIYLRIRNENSIRMVPPLIVDKNSKLNALKIADITPSGIDFHCSSVLNTVLSNHEVYNQLVKLVGDNSINDLNEEPNGTSKECNKTIPFTVDGKVSKDFILSKLKSCMWNFSSGRNNKSYIVENKMILNEYATTLQEKEIWKLISAHVDSYVVNYVSCRVNLLPG